MKRVIHSAGQKLDQQWAVFENRTQEKNDSEGYMFFGKNIGNCLTACFQ